MELVILRALEHEAAHLKNLKATEPTLVEISRTKTAQDDTLAAMRDGVPIIFQGELHAPPWMGIADFLQRIPRPLGSATSPTSPGTPSSRKAKPYFILQLCAYADMLKSVQAIAPCASASYSATTRLPTSKRRTSGTTTSD
jgi:hypothetical protein